MRRVLYEKLGGQKVAGSLCVPLVLKGLSISRDQPNSRFHGGDIFREIGLLP